MPNHRIERRRWLKAHPPKELEFPREPRPLDAARRANLSDLHKYGPLKVCRDCHIKLKHIYTHKEEIALCEPCRDYRDARIGINEWKHGVGLRGRHERPLAYYAHQERMKNVHQENH